MLARAGDEINGSGEILQRSTVSLALKFAPPIIAFLGVTRSDEITFWANHHETTLLIILFALVGSLVHAQLRHVVITSLCYGVAFLAARDVSFTLGLPADMRHGIFPVARMVALCTISILTLAAALGESFKPGTVWARRCYFGGASLYFFGTGIVSYDISHSWQAIMMIITGVAALGGAVFANKIVEMEKEETEDAPDADDEDLIEIKRQEHLRKLRDMEWKDPAAHGQP